MCTEIKSEMLSGMYKQQAKIGGIRK